MVATTMTNAKARMQTSIHLERSYPHPRAKVWRTLTDPALMVKWLMRPEGFATVVGTKFKLVDTKEAKGWRGFVECEVLAIDDEKLISYSWVGDEKHNPMTVTFALSDDGTGTKLVFDHTGFEGLGGWVLARFILGPGWKGMMKKRLPAVLDDVEAVPPLHD